MEGRIERKRLPKRRPFQPQKRRKWNAPIWGITMSTVPYNGPVREGLRGGVPFPRRQHTGSGRPRSSYSRHGDGEPRWPANLPRNRTTGKAGEGKREPREGEKDCAWIERRKTRWCFLQRAAVKYFPRGWSPARQAPPPPGEKGTCVYLCIGGVRLVIDEYYHGKENG